VRIPSSLANKRGAVLPESQALGHFKNEYEHRTILSYDSLGPKKYSLVHESLSCPGTDITCEFKVRGFFLKSARSRAKISSSVFKEMVRACVKQNK